MYEFETYVGEDTLVEIVAEIDPGEPARLTGHPDDMHPGEALDWSYLIRRNGELVSWEWEAEHVTPADRLAIDREIARYVAEVRG